MIPQASPQPASLKRDAPAPVSVTTPTMGMRIGNFFRSAPPGPMTLLQEVNKLSAASPPPPADLKKIRQLLTQIAAHQSLNLQSLEEGAELAWRNRLFPELDDFLLRLEGAVPLQTPISSIQLSKALSHFANGRLEVGIICLQLPPALGRDPINEKAEEALAPMVTEAKDVICDAMLYYASLGPERAREIHAYALALHFSRDRATAALKARFAAPRDPIFQVTYTDLFQLQLWDLQHEISDQHVRMLAFSLCIITRIGGISAVKDMVLEELERIAQRASKNTNAPAEWGAIATLSQVRVPFWDIPELQKRCTLKTTWDSEWNCIIVHGPKYEFSVVM